MNRLMRALRVVLSGAVECASMTLMIDFLSLEVDFACCGACILQCGCKFPVGGRC